MTMFFFCDYRISYLIRKLPQRYYGRRSRRAGFQRRCQRVEAAAQDW